MTEASRSMLRPNFTGSQPRPMFTVLSAGAPVFTSDTDCRFWRLTRPLSRFTVPAGAFCGCGGSAPPGGGGGGPCGGGGAIGDGRPCGGGYWPGGIGGGGMPWPGGGGCGGGCGGYCPGGG